MASPSDEKPASAPISPEIQAQAKALGSKMQLSGGTEAPAQKYRDLGSHQFAVESGAPPKDIGKDKAMGPAETQMREQVAKARQSAQNAPATPKPLPKFSF